jgi:tRNA pseudouridine 55 synthase
MTRRPLAGVINLLKPPGITSHDAVARMRRILGERRIGHGGTLDPGAAGVLPILVGPATKLMPFVTEQTKAYRAEMTLGIVTDTQDASGETIRVSESFSLPPVRLGDAMAAFLGEIEQVPPMTSAIRVGGRRLYELARKGHEVERPPRKVHIYEMHVVAVLPRGTTQLVTGTRVLFDVVCSKGTYIRTLCHDIGERLGCGAHMSFLVRTRVGPYTLEKSHTFAEIEAAVAENRLAEILLEPESAVEHLARYVATEEEAARLKQGQAVTVRPQGLQGEPGYDGVIRVSQPGWGLVCIGRLDPGRARISPIRVIETASRRGDERG